MGQPSRGRPGLGLSQGMYVVLLDDMHSVSLSASVLSLYPSFFSTCCAALAINNSSNLLQLNLSTVLILRSCCAGYQTLYSPNGTKIESLVFTLKQSFLATSSRRVANLHDVRLFSSGGSSDLIEWDLNLGCILVRLVGFCSIPSPFLAFPFSAPALSQPLTRGLSPWTSQSKFRMALNEPSCPFHVIFTFLSYAFLRRVIVCSCIPFHHLIYFIPL